MQRSLGSVIQVILETDHRVKQKLFSLPQLLYIKFSIRTNAAGFRNLDTANFLVRTSRPVLVQQHNIKKPVYNNCPFFHSLKYIRSVICINPVFNKQKFPFFA